MNFDKYYLVLLKKGPAWTPDVTPELEALQERHIAHLAQLHEAGHMSIAGPLEDHSEAGNIRGISIFPVAANESLEAVKALVENDPTFLAGRLAADYLTWYVPEGSSLSGDNS